jgi:predicted ABC-type ATPase
LIASTERPTCTVIGGPNGGGKSSLYETINFSGAFINADVVARQINPDKPGDAALAAGRQVLRMLDQALRARMAFCYETTLSSNHSLRVLSRARLRGYHVSIIFIALQDRELHVQRVRDRVSKGGHMIPDAIIRRRYDLSFLNLAKAIPLCHSVQCLTTAKPQVLDSFCELRTGPSGKIS